MTPDEEVVTAEPEVVEAPTPTESPEPVPEAQEPDADADATGESDGTRDGEVSEPESGTPTDEGEGTQDPIDAIASQLEALYERNPEAADRIAQGLPKAVKDGLQGADEIRAQLQAENAQGNRQGLVRQRKQLADSYNSNSFLNEVQPYIDLMATEANTAAKKLDGREENVLDGAAWGAHVSGNLSGYITRAKTASDEAARLDVTSILMDAFESHSSSKRITSADREAMNAAQGKPLADQLKAYVHTLLDVAERNAPEAFTVKKTKELEAQLGVADILKSIANVGGGNGRKATVGAGQTGASITNMDEADDAYNEGTIKIEQYKKFAQKYGVDLGSR